MALTITVAAVGAFLTNFVTGWVFGLAFMLGFEIIAAILRARRYGRAKRLVERLKREGQMVSVRPEFVELWDAHMDRSGIDLRDSGVRLFEHFELCAALATLSAAWSDPLTDKAGRKLLLTKARAAIEPVATNVVDAVRYEREQARLARKMAREEHRRFLEGL
jgi:hypothetical protein